MGFPALQPMVIPSGSSSFRSLIMSVPGGMLPSSPNFGASCACSQSPVGSGPFSPMGGSPMTDFLGGLVGAVSHERTHLGRQLAIQLQRCLHSPQLDQPKSRASSLPPRLLLPGREAPPSPNRSQPYRRLCLSGRRPTGTHRKITTRIAIACSSPNSICCRSCLPSRELKAIKF